MEMYFIAIVLPEPLNEKVLVYKKMMQEKYRCTVGLKSPAHLTLIPPSWMDAAREDELKKDLDRFSSTIEKFDICTSDFSAFKPRTIFIATEASAQLVMVKEKMDAFFSGKQQYPLKFDSRPYHPHITIATRDLHKKDFQDAWPYFEFKKFRECWSAEGISLLKHNKKKWDVVHTSQFKNID